MVRRGATMATMWTICEGAALCLGLGLFALIVLRIRRHVALRRIRRCFRRGASGQRAARGYLEQQGFQIAAEEYVASAEVDVDGERQIFDVRIDYLVRRRGRLFGVEVKTGDQADPLARPTRRQLREYAAVLPVDGLYLLDMDRQRLMQVRFPARRDSGAPWLVLVLGVLLAALVALAAVLAARGR